MSSWRPRRGITPSRLLLLLASLTSGTWASKKAFNIHDDLLATPQYQILFPDEYILESQAIELLRNQNNHATASGVFGSDNDRVGGSKETQVYLGRKDPHHTHASDDEYRRNGDGTRSKISKEYPVAYEEMILQGQRYLCQIPQVPHDEHNATSSDKSDSSTGDSDEAAELARATERGLELLAEMEGKCMYYVSGWWSYSFCYMNQVRQFHALPLGGRVPSYPPVEDPQTQSFVLGRFPGADDHDNDHDGDHTEADHHRRSGDTKHHHNKNKKPQSTTDIAELQTKGGSRYLVQHLEGGTRCDLTGRNRRIEVEFHCHPQSTDRIGMIKEVTTCSYLMVIYTPRLCNDVAFQPPQQEEVHDIECREILAPEEVEDWEAAQEYHLSQRLVDSAVPELPIIGDIVVGGKKLVGTEGRIIEKGMVASAGEEKVQVVAWKTTAENGAVGELKQISKDELKKVRLDPEQIEKVGKQLEEKYKGRAWRLELVEVNGMQDLRVIIESDDDDDHYEEKGKGSAGTERDDTMKKNDAKKKEGATKEQTANANADAKTKSTADSKKTPAHDEDRDSYENMKKKTHTMSPEPDEEGSTEEYFLKDEL